MSQCIFKREIHAGDGQLAKPLVSEVPYKIRGSEFKVLRFRGSGFGTAAGLKSGHFNRIRNFIFFMGYCWPRNHTKIKDIR